MKSILKSWQDSIRGATNSSPSASASKKIETGIPENLTSDCFQLCKIVRHGFPYRPTAIAYDPMQKLLAIGNMAGYVRLLGQQGVDINASHDTDSPVVQLLFLVNEGGLISVCADNSVNLWNLRQKKPGILHSLSFNRERITFCHAPYQSKWLYIGTDRGNVHMCSVENFILSGYVINWNRAIELSQKSHPGHIVGICENPCDENRLLIAFETGLIVLWDLKSKMAERRFFSTSGVRSVAWQHEGKQFMSCHTNGALSVWNFRNEKPQEVNFPHSRRRDPSKFDNYWPIDKLEWKFCRNAEPFLIFSGGLSKEFEDGRPSITVTHGRSTRVLEMDYHIVDFVVVSMTPWQCDYQDPVALIVLLDKDLVVIDLASNGFPTLEIPHPMNIHLSPVTCLRYFSDVSSDLTPGLYQVASMKPKNSLSTLNWPLDGGIYSVENCVGYPQILATGHADGVVRFWDASAASLRELYKLRTQKFFKKSKKDHDPESDISELDNYAISQIELCPESRGLLISNVSGAVIFCELHRNEATKEIISYELLPVFELNQINDNSDRKPAIETRQFSRQESQSTLPHNSTDGKTISKTASEDSKTTPTSLRQQNSIHPPPLKLRTGSFKQTPGFQSELICQLIGNDTDPTPTVTTISYSSAYGVFAVGTLNAVYLVDTVQKTLILSLSIADIVICKKRVKSPVRTKPPTSLGDIVQMHLTDQILLKSPTALEAKDSFAFPASNKSPHKESSPGNANSAGNFPPPRPKNPPKKSSSKKGSFSFEKSLDSQTSLAGDDVNFTRAQSVCDIDRADNQNMVTCLTFSESFPSKDDIVISPTLWVGTSDGVLFSIEITQPEQRFETQIVAIPTSTAIHMKGSIVSCAFLDSMGHPIVSASKNWKEIRRLDQQNSIDGCASDTLPDLPQSNPSNDKQFMIVTSESQIKVYAMPAQSLMHVHNTTLENDFIIKCEIAVVQSSSCVLCHTSGGRITIHSLPSLSLLMDVDYFPSSDIRISQTLCFTDEGQLIVMPTPTEVQRVTCSVEVYENMQEVVGHLFVPREAPERPNPGFFKSLFGGGVSELDREELFGEAKSGTASKAVARHIPGSGSATLEGLRGASQQSLTEMQKLKLAALERGERLGELEDKTQRMQESAQKFSENAHTLMMKYKNKKWYQL